MATITLNIVLSVLALILSPIPIFYKTELTSTHAIFHVLLQFSEIIIGHNFYTFFGAWVHSLYVIWSGTGAVQDIAILSPKQTAFLYLDLAASTVACLFRVPMVAVKTGLFTTETLSATAIELLSFWCYQRDWMVFRQATLSIALYYCLYIIWSVPSGFGYETVAEGGSTWVYLCVIIVLASFIFVQRRENRELATRLDVVSHQEVIQETVIEERFAFFTGLWEAD